MTAFSVMLAESPAQVEMATRIHSSLELTDGLRDLVPVIVAAAADKDGMSAASVADASASGGRLSDETRTRLREFAEGWMQLASSVVEAQAFDPGPAAMLTTADVMADPYGVVGSLVDIPTITRQIMPSLEQAPVTSPDEALYLMTYFRAAMRPSRAPVLLRALFVAAMGTLEPLVTRMVHLLLYHARPSEYVSLADPRLEKLSRDLCFGPPTKWRMALVDRCGVLTLRDAIDWDRLGALWEDRNAITHRAGIVDARHSSKTGGEIGSLVDFEPDELQSIIDEIGATRYAIIATVWSHMYPDLAGYLADATSIPWRESFHAGRWRQAEGLARVQEALADDPEVVADAKVNGWLARTGASRGDTVRAEVTAWNVDDLPPRFRLARMILLGQSEDALRMIEDLVTDGSVTRAELTSAPWFDGLRAEGRLAEFTPEPSQFA